MMDVCVAKTEADSLVTSSKLNTTDRSKWHEVTQWHTGRETQSTLLKVTVSSFGRSEKTNRTEIWSEFSNAWPDWNASSFCTMKHQRICSGAKWKNGVQFSHLGGEMSTIHSDSQRKDAPQNPEALFVQRSIKLTKFLTAILSQRCNKYHSLRVHKSRWGHTACLRQFTNDQSLSSLWSQNCKRLLDL